ncbi:MAG: CDP-diacylglycerol--glycerol-3-phosphate 3-phosphatidyltransferase [Nanoarchaeota archaeon]|nr:CDP-diacylglycerol--glycerol-3-phosphate 3-phosphatidyltransferase [Nanoarchaeota archaeon]
MKIPNLLTLIRFFLIPTIAFLLYSDNPNYILLSTIFFIIASLTDWADGFIARHHNQKSAFGTFFDPLIDKMLILTMFFIFVDLDLIPLWMALLILFRELLVTGIRQFCSTPKKVVGANWMGKSKLFMQTIVVLYIQIFLYLTYSDKIIFLFNNTLVFYLTLIMTIISLGYALNFLLWHRKEILSNI